MCNVQLITARGLGWVVDGSLQWDIWGVWSFVASLGMRWTSYAPRWVLVGSFRARSITHGRLFGVREYFLASLGM